MKINYSIKALLGLIGVYFLIKSIVFNKNDKMNYQLEINKVISSNLLIEKKVIEIDKILNIKSIYGQKMHLLSQKERDLVYIENLQREVNNGGFNQFYYNTSGNFALETEEAYKKIKAYKTALVIEKANNEFPNKFIPSDREKRIKLLIAIENKAEETWKECDRLIFQNEEYYFQNLYNYFISK